MCLTEVYPKEKIIKEGVGYKVFNGDEQHLLPCYLWKKNKKFTTNKWLKEGQFRIEDKKHKKLISGSYPFGFHFFMKLKDAKCYAPAYSYNDTKIIKKIKFRKGCAIGLNNWACRKPETIVAKEIFIPDERA